MDSKINGVLFSSVLFGLLHCANFFSVKNEYASSYVYLQCIFAFLIGIFYGLEMVLTDNIINVIILHIVNNIFASFVPIKRKIDLNDPIITSLLFITICIYSYYCYYGYHRLIKKMEEQDWSVVEEGEEGEGAGQDQEAGEGRRPRDHRGKCPKPASQGSGGHTARTISSAQFWTPGGGGHRYQCRKWQRARVGPTGQGEEQG